MSGSRVRAFFFVALATAMAVASSVTTAGASRSRGGSAEISDDMYQLLSYVPTDHRYVCRELTPDANNTLPQVYTEVNGISAALSCYDETVPAITYYQFSDAESMNRAFLTVVAQFETGADTDCPANGTWGFDDGTDGRIVCYEGTERAGRAIASTATRLWTDDRNNIMGIASLPDGDADFTALKGWWEEDAGPTQDADDTGYVDEPDDDDVDDLLASIPKQTRKTCEAIDRDEALGNIGEQVIVAAAVVCDNPAKGVARVFYYSIDADVIEDLIASGARSVSQEQLDETDDDELCPAFGTWSLGKGKKQRDVGSFSCYIAETDTDEFAVWNWTDAEQGIMGSAESVDDDATRVHEWWESDASGPLQS